MNVFKRTHLYVILVSTLLIFASCEGGTPLNMEADILAFSVVDEINQTITEVENVNSNVIYVAVPENVNVSKLTLSFTLSPGAKITPNLEQLQDFTEPVEFVVTSADGNWTQKYTITISAIAWKFDFEEWTPHKEIKYFNPEGWASGNIGTYTLNKLLPKSKKIAYPTYRIEDAHSGSAAIALETRKGGQNFMVPSIISGSLFIGNFNTTHLMGDPLKCPEFGKKFSYNGVNKPLSVKAYIKYTPGDVYTDENKKVIPDKTDMCSIQAFLFYGDAPLHVSDLNDDPRIIAKAYFETDEVIDNYQLIEIPFEYLQKIPDNKPLQMSISAASSKEGDYYKGAVGSKLCLDDIELILE